MIVMAGSYRRYGVPARPGKPAAKGCRVAATLCYNGYSMSGWRSRNRRPRSQSIRSRGRLMQASLRIVKKHSRSGVSLVLDTSVKDPPVIACLRWALAGKLPVAPRRVIARIRWALAGKLPAAPQRSDGCFVGGVSGTTLNGSHIALKRGCDAHGGNRSTQDPMGE